jgi:hypothetical protein
VEPGDDIVFIRKDKALNGTDLDPSTGLVGNDDAADCDAVNDPRHPVYYEKAPPGADYGGTLRRECFTGAAGCDPATCSNIEGNANYHSDCRYATEFHLLGEHDTVHPDRLPHNALPGTGSPPASPPWFDSLTDTFTDNGGASNTVAGQGVAGAETYEETGTYYVCHRQSRDSNQGGYNTFTLLSYVVLHVHHKPPRYVFLQT